jgi:hypothetical protein
LAFVVHRLALLLFAVLCLCTHVVSAELRAGQPKVRILVKTDDDRALLERVRGQTSDLELRLEVAFESDDPARPVDAKSPAFASVWFQRDNPRIDRVTVRVEAIQESPRRMLVREVGDGSPTPSGELSSATLEAVALVVREALRDLLQKEPVEAPPARSPPSAPPIPSDKPPTPEQVSFTSEVIWEVVFDGVGAFRRIGPSFRMGAKYKSLELGALAALSLPVTERDPYGDNRLRRYVFGLRAGRHWQASRALSFETAIVAGAVLYARSVQRLEPVVEGASDRVNSSVLLGPELKLGWAPLAGPVEIGLSLGLSVVPGAARSGYQVDGRFEPTLVIWRVQPSCGIGVKFRADRLM